MQIWDSFWDEHLGRKTALAFFNKIKCFSIFYYKHSFRGKNYERYLE